MNKKVTTSLIFKQLFIYDYKHGKLNIDTICLTILGHALLNHIHWLALCTYMLVRYANQRLLYTLTTEVLQ